MVNQIVEVVQEMLFLLLVLVVVEEVLLGEDLVVQV
jgi:hypothetical protein